MSESKEDLHIDADVELDEANPVICEEAQIILTLILDTIMEEEASTKVLACDKTEPIITGSQDTVLEENTSKKEEVAATNNNEESYSNSDGNEDQYFDAPTELDEIKIISSTNVEPTNLEVDETELLKMRGILFRFDNTTNPAQWKERGRGNIKFLLNREKTKVRIVMRRFRILKVCANHYILPFMKMVPLRGSSTTWVWCTPADFADEVSKSEIFAIKLADPLSARVFKLSFDKTKLIIGTHEEDTSEEEEVVSDNSECSDSDTEESEEEDTDSSETESEQVTGTVTLSTLDTDPQNELQQEQTPEEEVATNNSEQSDSNPVGKEEKELLVEEPLDGGEETVSGPIEENPEEEVIEEDDLVMFTSRGMVFKFDSPNHRYDVLGRGQVAIVDSKKRNQIRLLMIDDTTEKVCIDFVLSPSIPIQRKAGSSRALVWTLPRDPCPFSTNRDIFVVRFATPDAADAFEKHFELAKVAMAIRAIRLAEREQARSFLDNDEDQEILTPMFNLNLGGSGDQAK